MPYVNRTVSKGVDIVGRLRDFTILNSAVSDIRDSSKCNCTVSALPVALYLAEWGPFLENGHT
jgi:hypothetical protein